MRTSIFRQTQTPGAQSVTQAAPTTPYLTPGLATPSGRMSVVPMIIATPGSATPGARTPGSVAAAPYTGFPAGYAYGTQANYVQAAMTPQPMRISTTPGYVTPGGYNTVGGHATPSSTAQQRPSQSKNAGVANSSRVRLMTSSISRRAVSAGGCRRVESAPFWSGARSGDVRRVVFEARRLSMTRYVLIGISMKQ